MLAFGAQAAMAEGFGGPSYRGATATQSAFGNPTGSKPESKLWVQDGRWWAVMWDNVSGSYHIYWLDPQGADGGTWNDTGVVVDERRTSRQDVLSDGVRLYIASHRFSGTSEVAGSQAVLRRFIYNPSTRKYSLAASGVINNVRSETLVIAKDSANVLWATWTQGPNAGPRDVMVSHSGNGGENWSNPTKLGTAPTDDISSVVAYGSRVGVMWNNGSFLFKSHPAGATGAWTNAETAATPTGGADDHINLKASAGVVYAAVKTGASTARLRLLVRQVGGGWTSYDISNTGGLTRPIVLLDGGQIRVFANGPSQKSGTIFEKAAGSPAGLLAAPAVPRIRQGTGTNPGMVDVTSTKQNLNNATTGLVVLASNEDASKTYWAYRQGEPASPPPPPPPPPAVNVIRGNAGNNLLIGTSGRDVIYGGRGNDRIYGRGGNDRIVGGPGRDRLVGGLGRDTMYGMRGRDTLYARDNVRDFVNGGPGRDRARRDRGVDRLRSIERII
jgi:Ca2+-binding RTX toxin-like protein